MREYDFPDNLLHVDFHRLSRAQAEAYFGALMEVFPHRIDYLQHTVRLDPRHRRWRADFSMNSLEPLRDWFSKQVKTERVPEKEREMMFRECRASVPSKLRNLIKIGRNEIPIKRANHRTKCISFDIGLYLCEVIRRQSPGATWRIVLKPKSNIHYQEPCVGPLHDGMDFPFPQVGDCIAESIFAHQAFKGACIGSPGGLNDYVETRLRPFVRPSLLVPRDARAQTMPEKRKKPKKIEPIRKPRNR